MPDILKISKSAGFHLIRLRNISLAIKESFKTLSFPIRDSGRDSSFANSTMAEMLERRLIFDLRSSG